MGKARLVALAAIGGRLKRVAHDRGISHVHVHSCADSAHIAMFAHLLGGPSYSITLHGSLSDYGPNQREKWRHAAFAVVITERLLGEVRRELAGSLPPTVEIAPMGVETERFVRSAPYRAFSGDCPLRVFSCGRLNPCKGHSDLIRAIAELRARGFDARLEIAGEDERGGGGYHQELAAEIKRAGLDHAVTLLGAVSEQRVLKGLEEAHVFALASLAEPLGVAIMEAMALGTPVAVTGAGGVPELVRDGQDGLLVPPADATAMADAIERIARDVNLAAKLADSARARVVGSFDSKRSASLIAKYVHRRPSANSV